MDMKIYVITHKEFKTPDIEGYIPLMVGCSKKEEIDAKYVRDDQGENISEYNNSYCELTGLYWIWKNDNSEYVGMVHYRRLFVNIKRNFQYRGRYVMLSKKNAYAILEKYDLEQMLQSCDMIVKKSEERLRTNWKIFVDFLGEEFCSMVKTVIENESKEYVTAFQEVMEEHSHMNCNMFVGKKEIVNQYCEWLFPLLNKIDEIHIQKSGERYNKREIGYIGEMLFEVWIKKHKIHYQVVPVVNTDDSYAVNGVMNFAEFLKFYVTKTITHIFHR